MPGITIRLKADAREHLEKMAADDHRSKGQQVEHLIEQEWDRRKKRPNGNGAPRQEG